jgi:hypothetical protein
LKNSFVELIRERKVSLLSVADAQHELKRDIERATNKRRKATKNELGWNLHERKRHIGLQEMERKAEAHSRQEAVSRGSSHEASLHKPELFLPPMGHAEGCPHVRAAP